MGNRSHGSQDLRKGNNHQQTNPRQCLVRALLGSSNNLSRGTRCNSQLNPGIRCNSHHPVGTHRSKHQPKAARAASRLA